MTRHKQHKGHWHKEKKRLSKKNCMYKDICKIKKLWILRMILKSRCNKMSLRVFGSKLGIIYYCRLSMMSSWGNRMREKLVKKRLKRSRGFRIRHIRVIRELRARKKNKIWKNILRLSSKVTKNFIDNIWD